MTEIPEVLRLAPLGENELGAPHPAHDPEGRNVVYSGQLMAQMIMAADRSVEARHDVKSIHAVFSRAGTYDQPMTLQLETTHAGRTFGSVTSTAFQDGRLLSRGLLLLDAWEDDLVAHHPAAPDVPGPDGLEPDTTSLGFPGTETRTVPTTTSGDGTPGTPAKSVWVRAPFSSDSSALNRAVLVWAQPGEIIGLALRPHADVVSIERAHVSISTGVIAHTAHFHERFDVGDWLLVRHHGTYAGHGRVHGTGEVWDRDGRLVSSFSQDSMVRAPDRPLEPGRSM